MGNPRPLRKSANAIPAGFERMSLMPWVESGPGTASTFSFSLPAA